MDGQIASRTATPEILARRPAPASPHARDSVGTGASGAPASVFRRAISPSERQYLASQSLSPSCAIQIIVEAEGEPGFAQLCAAVSRAAEACPGSRLVARKGYWVDSGKPPPVRQIEGFDGREFDTADFLHTPLNPFTGPSCEVIAIRSPRSALLFRAFPGVMDAQGVLLWMREVFRALRGEALRGAVSLHSDASLMAKLGPVGQHSGMYLQFASPLSEADGETPGQPPFRWMRRSLRGRHPGLVAKLASVVRELSGAECLRFAIPVNLRRHDASLASTANLSRKLYIDARRGDSWEILHQRLLDGLAARRELILHSTDAAYTHLPLWALRGITRLAARQQKRSGSYQASATIAHLGRIDPEDFSAPGFSAHCVYALPAYTPLVPLSIAVVECGDHLELSLSCPAGKETERDALHLLDRIEERLQHGWPWSGNATEQAYPLEKTVVALFREQRQRSPHTVALVRDGRSTSYAELDRRSDVVAQALRSRGVAAGQIVGLLADRREDTIAALLGILKIGAAYLPLDPQYPDERIAFMLRDSGAVLCIAQAAYEERLAGSACPDSLLLEELDFSADAAPVEPGGSSQDLAYVIYTSGSTGRPKGVQIEHRSLVNYLYWAKGAYYVDRNTRFALFTSLAFDLSVTALFLPLIAGGSIALFPEDIDHLSLKKLLENSSANALKLTPTHLELMCRLGSNPSSFRTIIVGGEPLRGALAARSQAQFGVGCRIFNEYGPTEATVGCTAHQFDKTRDTASAVVPIGRPASNTRILLLDSQGKPVQTGDAGEIHIVGACLARGYLNREEMNHEKFARLGDGTRAYRSGDLARINVDDQLEFLGRCDAQIKIRGHRIEPGELECVLEEHPAVERAVVLARRRGETADRLLYAYVVPRSIFEEAQIRAYLERQLPAYLIPDFLIPIERLPLTVNAKIDLQALPDPFADQPEKPAARVDQLEAVVARIWSGILQLDGAALGPADDFYRLGGDSLHMLEMLAAVGKLNLGPEAAFARNSRDIIQLPTLNNVCRVLRQLRDGEAIAA